MCRLMDGRNVMFVGDSLQGEFFLSFVSMALSQSIEDERFPNINEENFKKCDTLCKEKACVHSIPVTVHCGESVPSYSISQFGDKHLTLYNPETGRINEWVRSVTEKNFSIIMMNTGAWYINDSQTIGNLNETLHYIYSNNPKVSIMFRNTPPGHENCGSYFRSPPFNLSSAPRQSYKNPAYHWGDIVSQNEAIKEFLGVTFPQVLFIDVFSSTRMRYDSHVSKVDCLHYCIPGPIDEWCIFHFNALLQFFIKFVYKKEIKYENIKIHETPTKVLTMDEGTIFVYENENFVFSNRERHYIGKSGASSKNLGSIWEVYAVPVGEPYCSLNDTIL